MDPRRTVGRIYKEEYYTLLHTKNMKALGHVVSEKKIFYVCKCMGAIAHAPSHPHLLGGSIFDPRGMIRRIHVKLQITMLHTKYRSFGSWRFSHYNMADDDAILIPGARLAGFIMRTTIHCYTQIWMFWALWFQRRFVICCCFLSL